MLGIAVARYIFDAFEYALLKTVTEGGEPLSTGSQFGAGDLTCCAECDDVRDGFGAASDPPLLTAADILRMYTRAAPNVPMDR